MATKPFVARVLQREGERGLFASGHPATASDDDADDDGYDTETDSSDERQLGAGSATGRQSESTGHGECESRLYLFNILYGISPRRRLEIQGSSHHMFFNCCSS